MIDPSVRWPRRPVAGWLALHNCGSGEGLALTIHDARLAAELLATRLLRVGRGFLAPRLMEEVPEKYLEAMRRGMARLVKGEPIQYVLGEWDFYERYLSDAVNLLKPGGAVFFEIGENQGEAVRQLMFDCGFDDIKIEKDYAGHDRYAMAVLQ